VFEHAGLTLRGLEMLDVGAGQRLVQMRYFRALGNEVVGVDRDLIVQGFELRGYLKMIQSNGFRRAVKTAGRKALGYDFRFNRELERRLGAKLPPGRRLRVIQADATDLPFGSETFDFDYSSSVLQHLPDPGVAVREMARVVKSGGGIYVDLMPYTGPSGCLDIRILGGRGAVPHWAHLRASIAPFVQEHSSLNHLRLSDWRDLFDSVMPGNVLVLHQPDRDDLEREIREIRSHSGELQEFEIDELVTRNIFVIWRKD
jgi:ubiquinone/menaquinone biosynthesis C-methylase UbiE